MEDVRPRPADGRIPWFAALLAMSFASAAFAESRFDELLKRVPRGANALIAIDVRGTLSSPLAIARDWKSRHEEAFVEKPLVLPPDGDLLILASQLDHAQQFRDDWSAAIVEMNSKLSLAVVAKLQQGYLDNINETAVAWSPVGAYYVSFSDRTLGTMQPDNKQAVARWIDFANESTSPSVSDPLQRAAERVSATSPVVLALDLRNVVQPHRAYENMTDFIALQDHQDKLKEIVDVVTGLQALTLEVQLREEATGKLIIEFLGDPSVLGEAGQPTVLEALNLLDAHLPDFEKWKLTYVDNAIEMEGKLSDVSLRRIFSLLEIPDLKAKEDAATEQKPKLSGTDLVARKSRVYFHSVTTLIDDLESTLGDTRDNHALWMERYAKKIDQLPILNVDEDLLTWGANVSASFREMGLAEREAGIRTGVRKSSVYGNRWNYSSTRTYDGYYGWSRPTSSIKNQITREERAAAKEVRYRGWQDLENSTSAIRRTMTSRYGIEF